MLYHEFVEFLSILGSWVIRHLKNWCLAIFKKDPRTYICQKYPRGLMVSEEYSRNGKPGSSPTMCKVSIPLSCRLSFLVCFDMNVHAHVQI